MAYSAVTVDWAYQFDKCWRCGKRGLWKRGLIIHHFVQGSSRHKDDLATTAIACVECHAKEHNRKGAIGMLGWIVLKLLNDPQRYDRERVNELRHRSEDAVSEADVALEIAAIFHRRVA